MCKNEAHLELKRLHSISCRQSWRPKQQKEMKTKSHATTQYTQVINVSHYATVIWSLFINESISVHESVSSHDECIIQAPPHLITGLSVKATPASVRPSATLLNTDKWQIYVKVKITTSPCYLTVRDRTAASALSYDCPTSKGSTI